ncbi:B-lymphocyte antigen CD19 [Carettochelys insculpta]|uniref:B-lymphocyte antigen CD19 n=1 Tax=Carettochelys insculpta TaxID=44489 RepID=UPI003EB9B942
MASTRHGLLLLLLRLSWAGVAWTSFPPTQKETARWVNVTVSKAAVLPCGVSGAVYGEPPPPFSWLWKGPRGKKLLSLNMTLGELPFRTGMGIGVWGSLVLPNVSTSDAGIYSCQWDQSRARNVLLNVLGSRELYVAGSPGGQIELPCSGAKASEASATVNWFWDADDKTHPLVFNGSRHRRIGNSLLILELGPKDAKRYRCQDGNQSWTVHLRLGGELSLLVQEGDTAWLSCRDSMPDAWVQGYLAWKQLGPGDSWNVLVELAARRWGAYMFQLTLGTEAALVLPAVMPNQAGTYHCERGNHSHSVELGVIAHAGEWQPWIVGATALGYVALGLTSLFGYCWIHRALRSRRRRKRWADPGRRFFKVTGNGAHTPYGNVPSPAGTAGVGLMDAVPYENVVLAARRQERPLPPEGPTSAVESEDEEKYEHPDSDEEPAPEDGNNYENTDRDLKLSMGHRGSSEGPYCENSLKENRNGDNWASDALHYSNAGQGPTAEDLVSEDGECYENTEDENGPLSPGATRLITDLRMLLLLGGSEEVERDRQDGRSEGSAGSQAYEEMAGALYAAPTRYLHLRDRSQEEDADSYENMEAGLGGLLTPREGSAQLRGDAAGLRAPGPAGAEPARRAVPRSQARE